MDPIERDFFSAALSAGSILTGFCGTFLSFRIGREAAYYRQPVLQYVPDKNVGLAQDVPIGLTHFSSSFLILLIASLVTMGFGFILPLIALAGFGGDFVTVRIVTGGLVAAVMLISGYFLVEMQHYYILSNELVNDLKEKRRELWLVAVCMILAVGLFALIVSGQPDQP